MFPPTQSMDEPDRTPMPAQSSIPLPRGVTHALPAADEAVHTALSSLTPSLLQDLQRFDPSSPQRELLEVLAACIRHTQPLAIDIAFDHQSMTLSIYPLDRLMHCPVPPLQFLGADLTLLRVLAVRPAFARATGLKPAIRDDDKPGLAPLRLLLWVVALRGARDALLPELAGQAAYRVAPGLNLAGLDVPGAMADCINRLRRQTCNLSEIASWHDIGRERAMRLLNALYLQAGLIISRSHPAATNEGWSGY